jgi:hypothetical protein
MNGTRLPPKRNFLLQRKNPNQKNPGAHHLIQHVWFFLYVKNEHPRLSCVIDISDRKKNMVAPGTDYGCECVTKSDGSEAAVQGY